MFTVRTKTKHNFKEALSLIGEYKAEYKVTMYDNDFLITVPDTDGTLVEMAFQMNWTQANEYLCVACRKEIENTGEGEATCGHLTFNKPINASF